MPRRSNPVPSYRLHKQSGQAVVTVRAADGRRRDVLLGRHGTEESLREYRRVLAELAAGGPVLPAPGGPALSVNEVLVAFMRWALTHYRAADGEPTSEVEELKRSLSPLRELYGTTPAASFGPKSLAAVRERMVSAGLCRSLVNRRVDRVRRVFKWATSEELVPVAVYQALRTLPGLRKGRTLARESEPIVPVDTAHVAATLPFLSRHLRAMVRLMLLTGMRPGEACRLKFADLDRTGEPWVYRPVLHKSAHRGKGRAVLFGPKARALLLEFLRGDAPPPAGFDALDPADLKARLRAADAYDAAGRPDDAARLRDVGRPVLFVDGCVVDPTAAVFCPRLAREERYRLLRRRRKTKVQPSQVNRRAAKAKRMPKDEYRPMTVAHAVPKAALRGGVPPWHPNQLRHTFGTEVRRTYGLEAAQVLLGHTRADVTQVYAERDTALAAKVAAEIG